MAHTITQLGKGWMEIRVIDCYCSQEWQEKLILDQNVDGWHRYGCRCRTSKIIESYADNKGAC